MSRPVSCTRTNYFSVKDEDAFRAIVTDMLSDTGETPTVFTRRNVDDQFGVHDQFGFCVEGELYGTLTDEAKEAMAEDPAWPDGHPDEACDMDEMIARLQDVIAPGDACIVTCTGHESTCSLWGTATVITSDGVSVVDVNEAAVAAARNMLGNAGWKTRLEY